MARTRNTRRSAPPQTLLGATKFSDDRAELDPVKFVRILKSQKHLCDRLVRATSIRSRNGRRREKGDWTLAYLAYVTSKKFSALEPWWTVVGSNEALWRECGFKKGRPPYSTVNDHFIELEQFAPEFQVTINELVNLAQKGSRGLVGLDVHVDSCEEETPARLVHDCQEGEPCKREDTLRKRGYRLTRNGRRSPVSPPMHPYRDTCNHAGAERGKLADEPPFEADKKFMGGAEKAEIVDRDGTELLRVRVNGCWYRSLDTEAGIRAYTRKSKGTFKFWHGYYNTKAIDHYTGAPIAIVIASASTAEYHIYPIVLQRLIAAVGGTLRSIVADKGFSIESVFKMNTERGIYSIMPFRRGSLKTRRQYETNEFDEHGIPKCKHCGHEGVFVSFTLKPKPRLLFRCSVGCAASNGARQSINCERKWRFLLPLWRTTELYMALRNSHNEYERVHGHFRRRYHVGGDAVDSRIARMGLGARQLRANAAVLIEWVTICWREGWFGGARRNLQLAKTKRGHRQAGGLKAYRRRQQLARAALKLPALFAGVIHGCGPPPLPPPALQP